MVAMFKDKLVEGGRSKYEFFFQSKAVWRVRKYKIQDLADSIGNVHSDFAMMSMMANEYFKGIFTIDPSLNAWSDLGLLTGRFQTRTMICYANLFLIRR